MRRPNRPRHLPTLAWVVPAVALSAAGFLAPTGRAEAALTRVTYVAGSSVYIDAGRDQGVAVGDTVSVVRGGAVVAVLRVSYVSTSKASCDTLRVTSMPEPGDSVRYTARAAAPDSTGASPAAGAPGSGATAPSWSGPGGTPGTAPSDSSAASRSTPPRAPARTTGSRAFRGRAGVGWIHISGGSGAPGYSQPSVSLRLDGSAAGGAPLDFSADVRSHRTYQGGTADGETRVYRLEASVRDGSAHRRFTVGRQPLPIASSAGLFDGALAQVDGTRVSAGLYSGLEPAATDYGFSTEIVQTGLFLQLRNPGGRVRRWTGSLGFADSRDHGHTSRDFFSAQLFYLDRRLLVSAAQEVDANGGWKRGLGEPLLSPTSTFVTARAALTQRVSLDAGYDNRRNVRLYRDRDTPETAFDDRYREGTWFGASVDPAPFLRLGATGRVNSGGTGGSARSWSGTAEAYRLTSLHAIVRLRSTRVDSDAQTGWLHSGTLEVNPWAGVRLSGTLGTQHFTDVASGTPSRLDWQGLDADLGLARRWYLLLSAEHDHGSSDNRLQTYTSLNWMF